MARPQLLSYSEYASSGNETNYIFSKPSGTSVGDFIIVGLTHSNNSNNMIPPGGVNAHEIYDESPDGQVSFSSFCWVVQATDPAQYEFLGTHSGRVTGQCLRIGAVEAGHEADPAAVLDFVTSPLTSGTTTDWNVSGGNPTTDETLGICFIGANGGAAPIVSTSTWNDISSIQSGTACANGAFQKDLPNPPGTSGDAFGNKDNSGRWYGFKCGIKPESAAAVIDLDMGHIDGTPTVQPLGFTADAQFGLGNIDATPIIRAMNITATAELDLNQILALPTVYPITFDALTAFALQPIDARATVYPLDITQPGVATELDMGHIIATPTVYPLEIQVAATLLLQPIDATPTVHPANITCIAQLNLAKIDALATIYEMGIVADAQFQFENIDAIATIYPMNLKGPIEEQGDIPLMKIIGPPKLMKMLANKGIMKILK